jgi:excisionase family DNA binding protein
MNDGLGTDILAEGLMTVMEAVAFLRISRSWLYQAMDAGHLPFVRLGRTRRIPRRAILELAAANLRGGWLSDMSDISAPGLRERRTRSRPQGVDRGSTRST